MQREAIFSGGIRQTSLLRAQATDLARFRPQVEQGTWVAKPVLDSLIIMLARSTKAESALAKALAVQIPIILLEALTVQLCTLK